MIELTKEERGYLVDCLRIVAEADPNGAALRELADRLAEAQYVLVGASGILDCSEPGRVGHELEEGPPLQVCCEEGG